MVDTSKRAFKQLRRNEAPHAIGASPTITTAAETYSSWFWLVIGAVALVLAAESTYGFRQCVFYIFIICKKTDKQHCGTFHKQC